MALTNREYERGKLRIIAYHDLDKRNKLIDLCRQDIVFWVNTFCYTYDPRLEKANIPFLLFPKQEEILQFFESLYTSKRRGLLDKSRDVGATWLLAAFLVHKWLFVPGFKGSVGSRKFALVDSSGDPDSIFEKIRLLIRNLPSWMQPTEWERISRIGVVKNPINHSVISGEAGDELGRGGRSSVYFVDEAAFIERSKKVIAALSQNTDCLIQVSTPCGTDNEFYRGIASGNYPHISIHWKDDPRKNHWVLGEETGQGWDAPKGAIYPWYERQCLDLDPVTIAQELDLDYTASVEGILIRSVWVRAAVNAHLKLPEIDNPNAELCAGLDVAAGGANKSVLTIRRGGMVLDQIRWGELDPVQLAYTVDTICRQKGIQHLVFDSDGVGMGCAGTFDQIEDKPYALTAFHGASTEGLDLILWRGENKTAKDKFKNKRAASWGEVAERFRKTYSTLEGIEAYPADELISIPNEPSLITQLSQPTIKYSAGKIVLTEKNLLASSPDDADSLVYSFSQGIAPNWWM